MMKKYGYYLLCKNSLIVEPAHTESRNDEIIKLVLTQYPSIIVIRDESVVISSISKT